LTKPAALLFEEETMEGKPVRNFKWLGVLGLCLGVLGFITSFGLEYILYTLNPKLYDLLPAWFPEELYFYWSTWMSSLLGLISLIMGIVGKAKTRGRDRPASFSILLGILDIFFGVPSVFVYFGLNAVF
jgi:hypothetical protein